MDQHVMPEPAIPPPPALPDDGAAGLLAAWLRRLEQLAQIRLRQALGDAAQDGSPVLPEMPDADDGSPFAAFLASRPMDEVETVLLTITLAPHVRPDFFDRAVEACHGQGRDIALFGGVRGHQHRGVLPTGDTALFLLAGLDLDARLHWQTRLLGGLPILADGILRLESPPPGEPPMSGRLLIDPDIAQLILTGQARPPRLSSDFPAEILDTVLAWDALVLPTQTRTRIDELRAWVEHGHTLMEDWGMRGKLRPGCRALFFGPPGTGKTLTATLLGKTVGRPVFRIDLSMVVSKYIGETEKNLARVFDRAERKNWILFFDEADALFGKRAQVRDARDRYANQEVSYLLQRIEAFDGLAILASNLSNNVDSAFSRRFEHLVHFPIPKARERLELWRRMLPEVVDVEPGFDLADLANQHELSGGAIANAVRHACLMALARGESTLRRHDAEESIRREFAKENRLQ